MNENTDEQKAKRAAIVALVSLGRYAKIENIEQIETEIQKAVEEGLARIPWLILENVIVVEE